MIKKAIKLLEQGKFKQVEDILRPIIEKSPMNAEALFHLALARRDLGDIGEAIELLQQAIKAQPRNATLYFALGNMQLGIPDYDEAEANFLKSTGLDPNNVDARNGLAFLEIRQSRFKAAEHSLMIALNIDPDNVQALIFIGIALLEQGQHDAAIEHLQKAVKLSPESVQAQFCFGRALLAAGNAGFAVQCFENASKAEPETAEFKDWLACAQLNAGQIKDAKENFYKAINLGRINIEVLMGLVKVESLLGNTEDALGVMLQAVELAPDRHDLVMRYAEMLMESKRFDEAMEQLYSLQTTDFEPEQVTVRLAMALMQKGDAGQALKTLEPLKNDTSIDVTPETRLMLTWALQECDDKEGAAEQLAILLAMDKPLPDAVLFRARQMYDTGDDQAVELLQQLLKRQDIGPGHARQAQILLAAALEKAGDYRSAVMEYRGLADRKATVTQITEQYYQGESGGELPASAMDLAVTENWPKTPPEDKRGQAVFIFAWPGSGRNRLWGALQQNPKAVFLPDDPSEQRNRRVRLTDRQGANGLGGLDDANIRMSRRHYWKAAGLTDQPPEDLRVIDTQWLTTEMLPAIARYFPGTSVVVLTREPRDMAISWLQTGYQELESMAGQYQSQLDQLQKCRASLPLNLVEIDYDELLDNPEMVLDSLQQSLGLEPDAAVAGNFNSATARSPARSGDWKYYQDELAEVLGKFD
jgi:tetratricopeptide (TPR) repeat protein